MKYVPNRHVMVIGHIFHMAFVNKIRDPCGCTKVVHIESFGHHGKLLGVFGFWFFVFCVSNIVGMYSASGLECPLSQTMFNLKGGQILWTSTVNFDWDPNVGLTIYLIINFL